MSYDGFYGDLSTRGTANETLGQITVLKDRVSILAAEAEVSATNSEVSATTSGIKAAASVASAASALSSKNAAETSEVNAGFSEEQAVNSATAAALSETNAAESATTATSAKDIALTQAAISSEAATTAVASETSAEQSAAAALASKNSATASATTATTKAASAASSALAALNSQTAAKTSETNAKASETAALPAIVAGLRFCGVSATAPTTRPNGTALQVADEYHNSADKLRYSWSGSAWVALNASVQQLEISLASTSGGSKIGVVRAALTSILSTVQQWFSAQPLSVWEYAHLAVKAQPADAPDLWDWSPAFTAALQEGRKVTGKGRFRLKSKVSTKVSGSQFVGDGIDSTFIIVDPSFTGDCVFEMGDSSATAAVTVQLGFSDVRFDMAAKTIPAIIFYGARDGSYSHRVYINNFSGRAFATKPAGGDTTVATGKMCEGMDISQIIAFPQNPVTGNVFELDGLFESTLRICKAFGMAGQENNAIGFNIGDKSQSRGVKLDQCSAANMTKGSNVSARNVGIHYGAYVRDSWDYNTTFENIEGIFVDFHGANDGTTTYPFNCNTYDPRLFASTNAAVGNPAFLFRTANACNVEGVNYYSTTKETFGFEVGGFNNHAKLAAGIDPTSLISAGVVRFAVGSSNSNRVSGTASAATIRKEFILTPDMQYQRVLANGSSEQTDRFWNTFNMGAANKMRWRDAALTDVFSISGSTPQNGYTSMSLRVVRNTVVEFVPVQVGPVDTGGAGFRALRVPNA